MKLERLELQGAVIKTSASVSKGRSAVTITVRAPLIPDSAESLECREQLFTDEGDPRPDQFSTLVHDVYYEPTTVHLQLEGVAKQEVTVTQAAAGPFTIERDSDSLTVTIKLTIRNATRAQLAVLAFAMAVGAAPLTCRLEAAENRQQSLEESSQDAEGTAEAGQEKEATVLPVGNGRTAEASFGIPPEMGSSARSAQAGKQRD